MRSPRRRNPTPVSAIATAPLHQLALGDAPEQRTRGERDGCGRAHDRRQHQPGGRRREAADRVEVDDFEGKDQSGAEVVERVPGLKNEDRPR
jgi:hypothetical protein